MATKYRVLFRWDYELCNRNWFKDVKCILREIDCENIFMDLGLCDLEFVSGKIDVLQEESWN